jgi:Uma2 family endonuclease
MSTDAVAQPEFDYSQLVTQDDTPLDSVYQERQQKILTDVLYASWAGRAPDEPWWAASNVGVFYRRKSPAIVPDAFVAVGVSGPADITVKEGHSYYIWDEGKPPDVVVEMVSETVNGEDTDKLQIYSRIGIPWYVLYDPHQRLSAERLRLFVRAGSRLVPTTDRIFLPLNLGVTLWDGEFDGFTAEYLRWTDATGRMLPSKAEVAEAATKRADAADERADLEAKRADQVTKQRDEAQVKADRLQAERDRFAELLRKAGIDPTQK